MKLSAEIQAIHRMSRGIYGAELADCGIRVRRKRVARLMHDCRAPIIFERTRSLGNRTVPAGIDDRPEGRDLDIPSEALR